MASSAGMDVDHVDEHYLEHAAASSSTPASLKPFYPKLQQLHDRKLWYQLTLTVEEFLNHPDSQKPPIQIELYDKFVRRFSSKINQLQLAAIGVKVARQYPDPAKALAFLEQLATKVDSPESQDAYVYALMEAAHFKLLLGDADGTKAAMDKCGKILDGFDAVETAVHASFYRVCGDYYKAKAEYANYYKNSLLYLACVNVDVDLTDDARVQRAHDLSISALLGATIYNFGELLLHPILASLGKSKQHSWLSDLLFAFNAGDIGRFEALAPHLGKEPILAENQPFLRQKICLMSLIESVFKRAADDRTIAFATIAAETKLPVDEVEHLVMKALSLKLIRGTLDQVDQLARITWVQPRVLDHRQIHALQSRLNGWCTKVEEVSEYVKNQTPELFVSA
ncbi:related to 26S proteasome regulatory particle chain RPN9 [Sporisorium reilianum SRZ2]|uniref:Related to 26S proteasome regulatory particle chain RPN9 n=1 Tax=Sporisorium reilianum (strain SRZ2) TaxID=999809 RepID=E6ZVI2_SPORE|nr:related to 26S proteasome regulatory particle chain RPN9 [Sporisorium reilianum SRZ2]